MSFLLIFSKKQIDSEKFQLHEVVCKRNIKLCPVCKEPVHKNEMEDHIADHEKKPEEPKPEEKGPDKPVGKENQSNLLATQFENSEQFYEIATNEISLETAKIEGPTIKCSNW